MFSYQLDAHDRLIKAKVRLNDSHPFFSYILMNMNIESAKENSDIPSMGVNQFGDLFWNKDFVDKLTDDELDGVLCHESMHIATLTFQRENSRDHMLWNMATDLIINYLIRHEGQHLPKDCLLTDNNGDFEFPSKTGKNVKIKVADKTAEEIYDALMEHVEQIKDKFGTGSGGGKGQGDGDGSYKGSFDKHLPGDEDSEGKSQGKNQTEADAKANANAWKQKAAEAATAAKMKGNMSAEMQRELEGLLEPKIDWRKMLNAFITKDIPIDYTMRRPGRRFYSTGVYYPSVVRENLQVVTGIDVSGSISMPEYQEFMSELLGIATGFAQIKMRVVCWAHTVDPRDDIEVTVQTKNKLMEFTPQNSGGTDLSCFTKYCRKKNYTSQVYVILTDGYIESKPEVPNGKILFVLSKNGTDEIIKHYGTVCSLNDVERCITG